MHLQLVRTYHTYRYLFISLPILVRVRVRTKTEIGTATKQHHSLMSVVLTTE
jgi:hypothetical protein